MGDMAIARINGKMISWALRRSGASLESAATSKVSVRTLIAWEKGDEFPSEGQAEDLATRLGIAYPMLFMLNVPPDEPIKMPDLRTGDGRPLTKPSLGLLEVLDSTRARQKWFRAEMKEAGRSSLPFVGKFSLGSDSDVVARDMRSILDISSIRDRSANYEDFLKALVLRAEDIGILVMRSAVVGHATRRTLNVSEFRGFALPDPLAPIVFINDKDAKAAQIFTFVHEVAHVWLGASGISDRKPDERGDSVNPIELKCDAISAECLVPKSELTSYWNSRRSIDHNIINVSRNFKVSSLVVLRRAKDLNLITKTEFFTKVTEQYDGYKRREKEKLQREVSGEAKKKGGNFWNSFEIRNGRKFNATVARAVLEQRATYAEAGSLFGVNPGAASRYVQRLATP